MESETTLSAGVKRFTSEKGHKTASGNLRSPALKPVQTGFTSADVPGAIPSPPSHAKRDPYERDCRTQHLNFRFTMYLRTCFAEGASFHWAAAKVRSFAAAAKMDVKHLCERWFKKYRAWSTEYKFERVAKPRVVSGKKVRGGSLAWRVTRADDVRGGVVMTEIRTRLHGAIRAVVARYGRAHVDFEFVRKFCAHTRLPIEAVEVAWRDTRAVGELRIQWGGVGGNVKFVASRAPVEKRAKSSPSSNPQTSPGLSSPTERRIEYKQGCARSRNDAETPAASATPPTGDAGEQFRRVPRSNTLSNPGGCDPSGPRALPARFAALLPLQFCNRWVSPRKLFAKACWISHALLKPLHDAYPRVGYDSRHATNFAFEGLWLGYGVEVVVRAWREGVRRSHSDASYAGDATRPPSAAKSYAMRLIVEWDGRPAEERWREFFARERVPGGEKTGGSGGAGSATGAGAVGGLAVAPSGRAAHLGAGAEPVPRERREVDQAKLSARVAKLRATLAAKFPAAARPAEDLPEVSQGELASGLKARGMTFGDFSAASWVVKKAIWKEIAARKHK